MNRDKFMKRLELKLMERGLTVKERMEILLTYEEHFNAGKDDGKTEAEIIARLGKPEEIALEYGEVLMEPQIGSAARLTSISGKIGRNPKRNFLLALPAFIVLIFILLIWLAAAAVAVSGLFGVYAAIAKWLTGAVPGFQQLIIHEKSEILLLLISLGLISGGTLACIGMYYVQRAYLGFVDKQLAD
ncbi:MAG: hypothetical protein A2Y33_08775 [Spirochaetes bacterium GWF1_51_8]|nr:MAG: hypothetical protein A2Y33_08775 [Spirochaetes bacterium GWF1_51_8]